MKDKVALITGASSGIGWATAKAFAAKGSKVVLAARREEELASLASEIQNDGGEATFIKTDVSTSEDVRKMVNHTIQTYGRLDFAVNNAGIEGMFAPITEFPVGSVNSFLGFAGGSAYATSKHGMVGLTSSVSAELAPQGIRVNIVCPGFIVTPMHQRVREVIGDEAFEGFIGRVHQQRAGRPEEIASSIVFLCSDEASYITGTTLTPDGGYTMTI